MPTTTCNTLAIDLGGDDRAAFFNLGYDLTLSKVNNNRQLNVQIEQVDSSIFQAKALLEADRQDLIIRVAEAYFAYLNANETLAFRKAEKTAIGRQLNQVKAFFDAGRSAITDVKEAQATLRFGDCADRSCESTN